MAPYYYYSIVILIVTRIIIIASPITPLAFWPEDAEVSQQKRALRLDSKEQKGSGWKGSVGRGPAWAKALSGNALLGAQGWCFSRQREV